MVIHSTVSTERPPSFIPRDLLLECREAAIQYTAPWVAVQFHKNPHDCSHRLQAQSEMHRGEIPDPQLKT